MSPKHYFRTISVWNTLPPSTNAQSHRSARGQRKTAGKMKTEDQKMRARKSHRTLQCLKATQRLCKTKPAFKYDRMAWVAGLGPTFPWRGRRPAPPQRERADPRSPAPRRERGRLSRTPARPGALSSLQGSGHFSQAPISHFAVWSGLFQIFAMRPYGGHIYQRY